MTPLDPEIERSACAIRREVREETLTQRMLVEDNSLIFSDSKEEIIMADIPTLSTMGDYYKRTDEGLISRAFVSENPVNFDIEIYLWEHLARFYEITSICKPNDTTEDQVNLRLFSFSLIGKAKDWLLCLPIGTIWTWKELKNNFLEIFFTTT